MEPGLGLGQGLRFGLGLACDLTAVTAFMPIGLVTGSRGRRQLTVCWHSTHRR